MAQSGDQAVETKVLPPSIQFFLNAANAAIYRKREDFQSNQI